MPSKEYWAEIKKDPVRHRQYLDNMKEYIRVRSQNDPVFRKTRSRYNAKYLKKRYHADPEFRKRVLGYHKKWVKNNPETCKESLIRSKVCRILRDHGTDLQDDPEHLQTDFMIMLINRDDKKEK
jgi:hypothetical protein